MTPLIAALDSFRGLAPTAGDWYSILPEIVIAGLGVFALLQSLFLPSNARWLIPSVARIGLVFAAYLSINAVDTSENNFAGLLFGGSPSWRLLFITCALLTSLIASRFIKTNGADDAEYHHLLLLVTAAFMVLSQANHVVSFFVALEMATVGLYILVGFLRKSNASLEAGVKYLVAGGLSSALLLMGFVLLYGVAGMKQGVTDALSFNDIAAALKDTPGSALGLAGAALVICGVAFKIGSFPFQSWIPDVYQGAPTPTTALLATSSKAAGVVGLIILMKGPLLPILPQVSIVLTVLAAGSLLAGNLGALGSTQTKRALALSGVSHAGFILAALSTISAESKFLYTHFVVLFYLGAYCIATFATMGAVAAIPAESDDRRSLLDLRGLIRRSPSLTASLTLGIGSLAGIPPSLGFFTKLLVLLLLIQAQAWGLLALSVVSVAVSIYYYFAIIREATVRTSLDDKSAPLSLPWATQNLPLFLGILTAIGGILLALLNYN
jgi:NADH-quinone oxidoreductase subunit N